MLCNQYGNAVLTLKLLCNKVFLLSIPFLSCYAHPSCVLLGPVVDSSAFLRSDGGERLQGVTASCQHPQVFTRKSVTFLSPPAWSLLWIFLNVSLWQPFSFSQTASYSLTVASSPTPASRKQRAMHCQAVTGRGVSPLPQWGHSRADAGVGEAAAIGPSTGVKPVTHWTGQRESKPPQTARSGQTTYLLGCTDYLDPIWISLISKVSHDDIWSLAKDYRLLIIS